MNLKTIDELSSLIYYSLPHFYIFFDKLGIGGLTQHVIDQLAEKNDADRRRLLKRKKKLLSEVIRIDCVKQYKPDGKKNKDFRMIVNKIIILIENPRIGVSQNDYSIYRHLADIACLIQKNGKECDGLVTIAEEGVKYAEKKYNHLPLHSKILRNTMKGLLEREKNQGGKKCDIQ